MLSPAYAGAITMFVKAIALGASFSLLAIAALAWSAYFGNAFAYSDLLGIRGQEAALSLLRARALWFLGLALTAEALGVGTIAWHVLSHLSRSRRILATIGVSVVISGGTFACLRP